MKILFLILFLLPFVAFSQQTELKKQKKQIQVGVIKKSTLPQTKLQQSTYKYTNEYRTANGVPEDFPHFINTGNPKQDAENYHQAKQLWIKKNPARFEKIKHLAL